MLLDRRVANIILITGGNRGIGAATARLAAQRGYDVAIAYRQDARAAASTVAAIENSGGRALAVQADVTVESDVAALFDAVEQGLGTPSALVNNAGSTGRVSTLAEASAATLREVLNTNVLGCMLCSREAVRRMATRSGGRGGAIVNLSSGAATLGSAGQYVWYAASKAAVDSFTLGLAREVIQDGIRVNAVSPGVVDTEIHQRSGMVTKLEAIRASIPIGRLAAPGEIAEAILWLLSDAASYCVGANLRVSGGR